MNIDSSRSLKESLHAEVDQFLAKIERIYEHHQAKFQHVRNKTVDSIMGVVVPSGGHNINNEPLSNFLKPAFDSQTENNFSKMSSVKEITQVGGSRRALGSCDSVFISHHNKQDSFISNQSVFNYVAPLSKTSTLLTSHSAPQSPKQKHMNDSINSKFDSDVHSKSQNQPKKQYKVYSPELKSEIIDYASKHGIKETSERYHISATKISIWSRSLSKAKQTRGRKTVDPDMQERVCKWLEKQLEKGAVLTQKIIREKAKNISCFEDFKASKGWLQKFFKRRPELFKAYSQNRKTSDQLEVEEEINSREQSNQSLHNADDDLEQAKQDLSK